MVCYMVTTGNGDLLCDGISEHEIERIAQVWADRLAETVYYIESGTDLDSDNEDEGIAVEPSLGAILRKRAIVDHAFSEFIRGSSLKEKKKRD